MTYKTLWFALDILVRVYKFVEIQYNWYVYINWKFLFFSQGELVYVNYGRIEDFLYLTKNKSIDLTNKTLIARYGKIFRGDKVQCMYARYCQLPTVIPRGIMQRNYISRYKTFGYARSARGGQERLVLISAYNWN
jgi:hypothetical protein